MQKRRQEKLLGKLSVQNIKWRQSVWMVRLVKQKKVTQKSIEDIHNELCAYMVVRADSHVAAIK